MIANDRDAESLEQARDNTSEYADRIRLSPGIVHRSDRRRLAASGVQQVDGLLADLGVSRYQLTDAGARVFADGRRALGHAHGSQPGTSTAEELVNFTSEKELADLIFQFGEERRSRRIARAIVRARPISTTGRLARVIEEAVPRTTRLHPATQTFMALRMAVNDEPGELDGLLEAAPDLVKTGGRIVIVSFMSLEDRKVKQSFQALAARRKSNLAHQARGQANTRRNKR